MGNLGNQLFQFGAVSNCLQNKEKIFLLGFFELIESFPKIQNQAFTWKPRSKPNKRVQKLWGLLESLATIRILRKIVPQSPDGSLTREWGLLPISVFSGGFCQDPTLINFEAVENLVSSEINRPAKDSKSLTPFCFVHIRRQDYLTWPSAAAPAALPLAWYRIQMKYIAAQMPGAKFIIFSDEKLETASEFLGFAHVSFFYGDAKESLIEMSRCQAGILSASTFSWWAAKLASKASSGPFIAPKYWLGWRDKKWNPPRIADSFLTFVTVNSAG